jgi:hypothetical protein
LREAIIVVSGLPRSGTSMMMQMCTAAGVEALTDHQRIADEDNLKGYFELEKVKRLEKDASWLPQARGKVVKIISALLKYLPPEHRYKIIFMQRHLVEILQSQKQMLQRRGEPNRFSDEDLERMFRNHLQKVDTWLREQPNIEFINVNYNELLKDPLKAAKEIKLFLKSELHLETLARVADKNLYRQRQQN